MKKRTLILHSIYDHTGIVRYLEREAERGWLLEKVGRLGGWIFRSAPPQKMRYTVTYFEDTGASNIGDARQEYIDLCAAADWEFVDKLGNLLIFRTTNPRAVPIETEPSVQVENVYRSMKQEMRGNIFHLLCWSLILFLRVDLYLDAAHRAQKPYDITLLVFYGLLAVLLAAEAVEILIYYHWHHRAKRAAEVEERFLPTYGAWWRGALQVTISFAAIFVLAYDICGTSGIPVIVIAAVLLLYNFGSNAVKNHLAGRGKTAGRWADITVPLTAVMLIAMVCLLLQNGYLREQSLSPSLRAALDPSQPREIKYHTNFSRAPLTPMDFGDWPAEDFALNDSYGSQGVLRYSKYLFRRNIGAAEDAPKILNYTIYEGSEETMEQQAEKLITNLSLISDAEGDRFYPTEELEKEVFGAFTACHIEAENTHVYIFRWRNQTVLLEIDMEPDTEQLKNAAQLLRRGEFPSPMNGG